MSETKARFADALLFELMSNAYEQQQNNVDLDRFPLAATPRARARRALRDLIQGLFGKAGYLLRRDDWTHIELRLSELKKELPALERLAGRLSDDASRELLMRVVAYRTLGPDRVKLPLAIGDRYATQVEEMRRLVCNDETVAGKGTGGWTLNCFDLSSLGFPIRLFATSPGLVCTFTNRQYAVRRCARPGGTRRRRDRRRRLLGRDHPLFRSTRAGLASSCSSSLRAISTSCGGTSR